MIQVRFDSFPVIHTARFTLDQLTLADAPGLFSMRSNEGVMKYIDRKRPDNLAEIEALIQSANDQYENSEAIQWAVRPRGSNEMIGSVGFYRMNKPHYRCEIGYMLDVPYQGKGIMSEIVPSLIDFAFSKMKFHSIEAHFNVGNAASMALLRKFGFAQEAYHKENFFFNGKFLDTIVYGLVSPLPFEP